MKDSIENIVCFSPEQTAGGLWSTAADIAKFVLSIQKDLKGNQSLLIDRDATVEMLTPCVKQLCAGIWNWGEKYFWHDGENHGFNSMYYGSFTTGKGVVILTNAYTQTIIAQMKLKAVRYSIPGYK